MSLMSSLLKLATTVIPKTSVQYRKYQSKVSTAFGTTTQSFTAWGSVGAVVEPGIVSSFGGKGIELRDYKEMGLDWSRRYITVWMPDKGLTPAADKEGSDEVCYAGKVFTVLQVENWDQMNGWQRVYCVENKSKTPPS